MSDAYQWSRQFVLIAAGGFCPNFYGSCIEISNVCKQVISAVGQTVTPFEILYFPIWGVECVHLKTVVCLAGPGSLLNFYCNKIQFPKFQIFTKQSVNRGYWCITVYLCHKSMCILYTVYVVLVHVWFFFFWVLHVILTLHFITISSVSCTISLLFHSEWRLWATDRDAIANPYEMMTWYNYLIL